MVSELVANAVCHASPLTNGTLLVAWGQQLGGLGLAVTDGGARTVPHVCRVATSAPAGRGLAMVAALTDRWWVETTQRCCSVHAVLPLA